MGAYVNGCYHEHAEIEAEIARLKAQEDEAEARMDSALKRMSAAIDAPYKSALDREGGPAPLRIDRENILRGSLRDLLGLVEMSEMSCRDLPPHEYEAIHQDAVTRARAALQEIQ